MRKQNRGILVVVEGVDGVGKTTAIHSAYNQLKALGYDVVKTSESAKSVEGIDNTFASILVSQVREMYTQEQADATTQSLMINAARRAHYQNVIEPLLKAGKVIIMDRFYLSTFFNYQSECPVNGQIYSLAMGQFKPDYTVVLRANAETSRTRIAARGGSLDINDDKAIARFATIQNKLLSWVTNNKGAVIEATRSAEEVAAELVDQILNAMEDLMVV